MVFPNESFLQVVAPLPEAQLVETGILNQMHVQSLVATKAARMTRAAGERTVADFGTQCAHGADAALKAASAAPGSWTPCRPRTPARYRSATSSPRRGAA